MIRRSPASLLFALAVGLALPVLAWSLEVVRAQPAPRALFCSISTTIAIWM